ncbi:MAG: SixA phosphatase family protein [Acidobacteriota bacterium]
MHLLVIRHAVAEERQPELDDTRRELTRAGTRKFRDAVHGLRELGWQLDRVLTSPWKRALQTAELLSPITSGAAIESELLTRPPTAELLAQIAERTAEPAKSRHATAVVGHEPWLGELVAWLAFGDPRLGETLLLKKGGVAWLDGTAVPRGMRLRALLTPKALRAAAD